MAKKKATAKKGKKKGSHATGTKKRKGPRSQSLPGMERIRSQKLDACCEAIGDIRDKANSLRSEEKDELQMALREMTTKGIQAYRHAGVELVRVPGEEKLRVRKSKEDATDSTVTDDQALEKVDGIHDAQDADQLAGQ